jgi:hypothetical protein
MPYTVSFVKLFHVIQVEWMTIVTHRYFGGPNQSMPMSDAAHRFSAVESSFISLTNENFDFASIIINYFESRIGRAKPMSTLHHIGSRSFHEWKSEFGFACNVEHGSHSFVIKFCDFVVHVRPSTVRSR